MAQEQAHVHQLKKQMWRQEQGEEVSWEAMRDSLQSPETFEQESRRLGVQIYLRCPEGTLDRQWESPNDCSSLEWAVVTVNENEKIKT